jgi:hypothetical protein
MVHKQHNLFLQYAKIQNARIVTQIVESDEALASIWMYTLKLAESYILYKDYKIQPQFGYRTISRYTWFLQQKRVLPS